MAFTIGSGAAPIGAGAIPSNTFSSSNIGSGAAPFSAPIGSGATPSNPFPSSNIGSGATPSFLIPPPNIGSVASPSFSRPSPDPPRPSAFSISSTTYHRPAAITISSHHIYLHDSCHDICEAEEPNLGWRGYCIVIVPICIIVGVSIEVIFMVI